MLTPILLEYNTTYITVSNNYKTDVADSAFYVVTDANKDELLKMLKLAFQSFKLLMRIKPDVVISTGAAVGVIAIIFAKLAGKKTIWLDSMANVKKMSLSARIAKPFCDLWLTQSKTLAQNCGARYVGKLI